MRPRGGPGHGAGHAQAVVCTCLSQLLPSAPLVVLDEVHTGVVFKAEPPPVNKLVRTTLRQTAERPSGPFDGAAMLAASPLPTAATPARGEGTTLQRQGASLLLWFLPLWGRANMLTRARMCSAAPPTDDAAAMIIIMICTDR